MFFGAARLPSNGTLTVDETRTEHIRHVRLQGDFNSKMERMNGEIRDRERVMRTLEKTDTPIL